MKNKHFLKIRLSCVLILWLKLFILALYVSSCAGETSITVHYYRYSGDYDGWNVWVWPHNPPGEAQWARFNSEKPDKDGFVTARVYFPKKKPAIKEIGVIIRKSENNNDWAEKDVTHDRFTEEKEIWLVQGDPAIYTEKPATGNPPILFAAADSAGSVLISLPVEPEDFSVFAVYENERKISVSSEQLIINNDSVIRVIITLDEKITDPSKLYFVRDETGCFSERKVTMRGILNDFYYDGDDLGVRYSAEESGFKVWSPAAAAVSAALYDDAGVYSAEGRVVNNDTDNLHRMEKDFKTGVWSAVIKGNLEGKFYLYRVEFADGKTTWAADPYAKAVSANGQRMAIIDMSETNPLGWRGKEKPDFTAGRWQDAVICELHVRDFSIDENSGMKRKGKYLAFTERGTRTKDGAVTGVDHLVRLGITHVHLLPVYDYASINELTADEFNWGYDPMHYNVPEGSYSTDPRNPAARITEFKAMVKSLHDAGIRVIMDVVYNHTYQTGTWPFDALVPGYYYRVTDTGVYANGSGCGNEVASERPMVRKFIIDSCRYWAKEYNIDGFRFDLMGLIDRQTMAQLTEELRRDIDPTLIIYGEPWQAGGSVLPENLQTGIGAQRGLGFAVFNDRIRTSIKGGSDDNSRGFATGAKGMEKGIINGVLGAVNGFTSQANESVNYVTAHDNLNLWDKIALSHGAKDTAASPYKLLEGTPNFTAKFPADIFESDAVKSVLLANGIIFTSQGIPFFQAGDEFLRSKFGDHNSYKSPDSINMIRWENADRYGEVIDYYAGLIRLRKAYPAFRQSNKDDILNSIEILRAEDLGVAFVIREQGTGNKIFVAYNGSKEPMTFSLPDDISVWRQVVNARRAGTETLAEITGKVTVPALSMTVLVGGGG